MPKHYKPVHSKPESALKVRGDSAIGSKSDLPLNPCGKIVPPRAELDGQLDILSDRGKANGAKVEFWDADQLKELIPEARTASGRALWNPNTAVVKPIRVVHRLRQNLQTRCKFSPCPSGLQTSA